MNGLLNGLARVIGLVVLINCFIVFLMFMRKGEMPLFSVSEIIYIVISVIVTLTYTAVMIVSGIISSRS